MMQLARRKPVDSCGKLVLIIGLGGVSESVSQRSPMKYLFCHIELPFILLVLLRHLVPTNYYVRVIYVSGRLILPAVMTLVIFAGEINWHYHSPRSTCGARYLATTTSISILALFTYRGDTVPEYLCHQKLFINIPLRLNSDK